MNDLIMGIPGVGEVHPGLHVCALFSGPVERDRLLVPFLQEGLRHGDHCVCLIDELEPASMRQKVCGPESAGDARRSGRLDVYASPDAYLSAGEFSPQQMISFLVADPRSPTGDEFPLLRAAGQMSWVAHEPGVRELSVYESAVILILSELPAVFVCMYDVQRFGVGMLADVLKIHSMVLLLATVFVEIKAIRAGTAFSAPIKAYRPGEPAARVRRTIPPVGGVGVRIGLDQFEVAVPEVYIGISVREEPTAAALLGPATVPSTYANDVLRYQIRLPSGVFPDDPALRVRWTLEDRTHNVVLIDRDTPLGRRRLDFSPALFPGVTDFGISARLYRRHGPNQTDLANESVNLHMRGPIPQRAYTRWRSQVKNPQFAVDPDTDKWTYRGDAVVRRWSEWHRTDAPCHAVNAPNRFRFDEEQADRLPFPLRLLESHRKGLCPYCFYGGPAGINPDL